MPLKSRLLTVNVHQSQEFGLARALHKVNPRVTAARWSPPMSAAPSLHDQRLATMATQADLELVQLVKRYGDGPQAPHLAKKVRAHEVAAIVVVADARHLAVGEVFRLDGGEEGPPVGVRPRVPVPPVDKTARAVTDLGHRHDPATHAIVAGQALGEVLHQVQAVVGGLDAAFGFFSNWLYKD